MNGIADLFKSENPAIAMKAITYSLEFYPEVAGELPRLKRNKSPIGVWIEYTDKRWKKGEQHILKEMLEI